MSEVQRYKTVYTSDLYESDQGDLISAHDYDEAQSELSALREENERLKSESFEELYNAAIDERDALRGEVAKYKGGCVDLSSQVRELEHKMDYWEGSNTSLQQRLTAAEQRNAELEALLQECVNTVRFGEDFDLPVTTMARIDSALKPTESGASE
jgi:chromosome segregation ATPase